MPAPRTTEELAASRIFPVLLVLITMLSPLAMSSIVPALPAIQNAFGVSVTVSQLVLSLSLFATAVASLAYGKIADRFGRRPALLAGIGLATLGSLIAAMGPGIGWVVFGRMLQALGAGVGYTLVRVLVTDVYGPARALSVLGYVTAAMAVAPMAGPVVGGLLTDSLGWRWIFGVVGALSALLLLLILREQPETRPPAARGAAASGAPARWTHLPARPDYLRYLLVGVGLQATFFAFTAGAPYLLIERFGMSASAYGTHYVLVPVAFLLGSLTAGRLGGRLGTARGAGIGMTGATCASGVALLWLGLAPDNPWALLAPMACGAWFAGFSLPAAQAGLVAAAPDQPGVASGLFSFVQMTASALVAQAVGMGLQHGGPATVTGTMFACSFVGLVGFMLLTGLIRSRIGRRPAASRAASGHPPG